MGKRALSILCIAALSVSMLAGCGSSTDDTGSASADTETVEETQEETAAGSETGETVELEFLFGDPNRTEIFSRIVEEFNESQDGVHVTFNATGENHLEELMTRLATGDVPDLTSQLQGNELKSYVEAGHIKDIKDEPYMKYVKDTELDTVTIDGGVYGIPMDTQAWGVFYNKELFAQAGIESVPTTKSELEDCVEKLKAAGITPFAEGYATEWIIGQYFGYACSNLITPKVQELGDDYKKGNFAFELDEKMEDALDVLDLIAANTNDKPFDTDSSGAYAIFAGGQAAMMATGNWTILQFRELNPDIQMGMFPLPISDDPEDLVFPKQYGFVINVLAAADEDPAKAEAINTFMEYFLNPENGGGFYYDEIGVPTANAVAEPKLDEASEILQEFMKEDKTVFTYYCYEPAGFDAESWKITVDYLQNGAGDHARLIDNFNAAFDEYADALE